MAELMQVTEGDGYAVLALQEGYRGDLEGGGALGDSAAYSEVVADEVKFLDRPAGSEREAGGEELADFGDVTGLPDDDIPF